MPLVLIIVIGMVPVLAPVTALLAVARLRTVRMRAEPARWWTLLMSWLLD